MENKNLRLHKKTYRELADQSDLGLSGGSATLNEKTIQTLLHKPTPYTNDEVCQILLLDGDKMAGGVNTFTTRLKIGNEVKEIQSGSHLYVDEEYRKMDAGADLFMEFTFLHPSQSCLVGGISRMALKMYKALKYAVFEFPRLIFLRKSRSVVQSVLKTESVIINPIIWLADAGLALHRGLLSLQTVKLRKQYTVVEETEAPKEVEDIVLNDDATYMEVHDRSWFEWALRYTFSEDKRNQKRLFTIRKDGEIEAFFLTKMEFFEQASSRGFKNVYLGSVMEWGVKKGALLKESDVYLLALNSFPKECDGIQVASPNVDTVRRLKKHMFVGVGNANMAAKLGDRKFKEYNDINLWRVRLAAGDTIVD